MRAFDVEHDQMKPTVRTVYVFENEKKMYKNGTKICLSLNKTVKMLKSGKKFVPIFPNGFAAQMFVEAMRMVKIMFILELIATNGMATADKCFVFVVVCLFVSHLT